MSGSYCALGVDKSDKSDDMMIFGDSVMRNYFVAYDKKNNRVGFSQYILYIILIYMIQ